MMRAKLLLLGMVWSLACDRSPPPVESSPSRPSRTIAQIRAVTQLPPNRRAHVAVDTLGNVFYTVETDSGQDGVIVVSDAGVPRATQLSSANILAAVGESFGGGGAIQDIVAGPNGTLYFYFIGGKGRTIHVCVGVYQLQTEAINIVIDTSQLRELSRMGDSIALARGKLISVGSTMYLLLRHSDAWALICFDLRRAAPGMHPQATIALDALRMEEQPIDLARQHYQLAAGPEPSLLLMDKELAMLWKVDTYGRLSPYGSLEGLPSQLSAPLLTKDQRVLIFAADSPPLTPSAETVVQRRLPSIAYPALLQLDRDDVSAIGRDDLRAFGGFPVYAMRIDELIPAADGSYIAYDLSSGLLMRIRMTQE